MAPLGRSDPLQVCPGLALLSKAPAAGSCPGVGWARCGPRWPQGLDMALGRAAAGQSSLGAPSLAQAPSVAVQKADCGARTHYQERVLGFGCAKGGISENAGPPCGKSCPQLLSDFLSFSSSGLHVSHVFA